MGSRVIVMQHDTKGERDVLGAKVGGGVRYIEQGHDEGAPPPKKKTETASHRLGTAPHLPGGHNLQYRIQQKQSYGIFYRK